MKSRPKKDDQTLDLFDWSRRERAAAANDNGERLPCTCDRCGARFCDACIESGRADAADRRCG
jgi:hypothetical protein